MEINSYANLIVDSGPDEYVAVMHFPSASKAAGYFEYSNHFPKYFSEIKSFCTRIAGQIPGIMTWGITWVMTTSINMTTGISL